MTESQPLPEESKRYDVRRVKDSSYRPKPRSLSKKDGYTVPRSKWCKKPLWDGRECQAPKVAGKDGCVHHNTKDGGKYSQELADEAADKFQLPEMELNTIQDVIAFLSKLIMTFKNGGCDKVMATTLGSLCKELISAIKERDSNSPEAVAKKRDEIMAVVMAARSLGIDAAREVLLSRNFELLEMKATEMAGMTEEVINAETVLIETSTVPTPREAAPEADTP